MHVQNNLGIWGEDEDEADEGEVGWHNLHENWSALVHLSPLQSGNLNITIISRVIV